jgi:lipoyl-dependent peroxiredoxin subunit D
MTTWVDQIKEALPEYAKDTKLNLDSVINRSTLDIGVANACALAAAMATGNGKLVSFIQSSMEDATERDAALTASSLMAMTNTWYPFVEMVGDPNLSGLPPQLRMNAISTHGGTSKVNFEAYALAASIVGKCHFCVKAHYDTLKKEGMSVEQLRDIGRISAIISAVAKVLNS